MTSVGNAASRNLRLNQSREMCPKCSDLERIDRRNESTRTARGGRKRSPQAAMGSAIRRVRGSGRSSRRDFGESSRLRCRVSGEVRCADQSVRRCPQALRAWRPASVPELDLPGRTWVTSAPPTVRRLLRGRPAARGGRSVPMPRVKLVSGAPCCAYTQLRNCHSISRMSPQPLRTGCLPRRGRVITARNDVTRRQHFMRLRLAAICRGVGGSDPGRTFGGGEKVWASETPNDRGRSRPPHDPATRPEPILPVAQVPERERLSVMDK